MRTVAILVCLLCLAIPSVLGSTIDLQFSGTLSAALQELPAGMQTEFSLPQNERQEIVSHSVETGDVEASSYTNGSLTLEWDKGANLPLEFTFSVRYETAPVEPTSSGQSEPRHREYGPYIDTSDEIKDLAHKLDESAGEESTRFIYALMEWVNRELTIDSSGASTASEAMESRQATPAGANALAASLMRARDMPVRVLYGLIGDSENMRPGHWLEARIGDAWYPVDALRYQMGRLDSSHISLSRSAHMRRSFAHTSGKGGSIETERSDFSVSGNISSQDAESLPVKIDAEPFVDTMVPGSHNVLEVELSNTGPVTVVSCLTPRGSGLRFLDTDTCFYLGAGEDASGHLRFTSTAERNLKSYIGESSDPHLRARLNESVTIHADGENYSRGNISSLVERDMHIIEKRNVSSREAQAIFSEHYNESTSDNLTEQHNDTKDALKLRKYSTREKNVTNIHIDLVPHNNMTNVSIYERIPKCLAEEIGEIFKSSREYRIVEEDPLIMWEVENIDDTVSLSYGVLEKLRDTECEDDSLTLSVAHKIGDSLQAQDTDQSSPIVLYAVGGGLFFFVVLFLVLRRRRQH